MPMPNESCFFEKLPRDLFLTIRNDLTVNTLGRLAQVNKWCSVAVEQNANLFWEEKFKERYGSFYVLFKGKQDVDWRKEYQNRVLSGKKLTPIFENFLIQLTVEASDKPTNNILLGNEIFLHDIMYQFKHHLPSKIQKPAIYEFLFYLNKFKQQGILKFLYENYRDVIDSNDFIAAVFCNQTAVVQSHSSLSHYASSYTLFNDEFYNYKPLHIAARYNLPEMAEILISAGADVKEKISLQDYADQNYKWTPLALAEFYENKEMCKYFKDKKEYSLLQDDFDYKMTVTHACKAGKLPLLRKLLESNQYVLPNVVRISIVNLMKIACKENHTHILNYLITKHLRPMDMQFTAEESVKIASLLLQQGQEALAKNFFASALKACAESGSKIKPVELIKALCLAQSINHIKILMPLINQEIINRIDIKKLIKDLFWYKRHIETLGVLLQHFNVAPPVINEIADSGDQFLLLSDIFGSNNPIVIKKYLISGINLDGYSIKKVPENLRDVVELFKKFYTTIKWVGPWQYVEYAEPNFDFNKPQDLLKNFLNTLRTNGKTLNKILSDICTKCPDYFTSWLVAQTQYYDELAPIQKRDLVDFFVLHENLEALQSLSIEARVSMAPSFITALSRRSAILSDEDNGLCSQVLQRAHILEQTTSIETKLAPALKL